MSYPELILTLVRSVKPLSNQNYPDRLYIFSPLKDVLRNYSTGGKNPDALCLFKKLSPEKMNDWLTGMQ
jgi:hypothetical protein